MITLLQIHQGVTHQCQHNFVYNASNTCDIQVLQLSTESCTPGIVISLLLTGASTIHSVLYCYEAWHSNASIPTTCDIINCLTFSPILRALWLNYYRPSKISPIRHVEPHISPWLHNGCESQCLFFSWNHDELGPVLATLNYIAHHSDQLGPFCCQDQASLIKPWLLTIHYQSGLFHLTD